MMLRLLHRIFCVIALVVVGYTAHAQLDKKVSLTSGELTATDMFAEVRSQTGIRFSFDRTAMDSLMVNPSVGEITVQDLLDTELVTKGYLYRQVRQTIVVYPAPEITPVQEPTRKNFTWTSRVLDKKSGEPLPFATVTSRAGSATADSRGHFVLTDIPSDTVSVMIMYVGYAPTKIILTPKMIDEKTPVYLEQSRVLLPQAIVTGSRIPLLEISNTPSTQAMNPLDLSVISGNGEPDVLRAAQLLPGVAGTLENSGGLFIRGSDADQSLVSFDGFTIYHLDHFYGIFSAFNANAIKNLRIHKGGMDARFGGRTAGWVEVTARQGNMYVPRVKVDLSMLAVDLMVETPVGTAENASFMFAARRSITDKIQSPLYKELFNTSYNSSIAVADGDSLALGDVFGDEDEPDFRFFDLIAKLTYKPSKKHQVEFTGFAGNDKLAFNYDLSVDADRFHYVYSDENQWGSTGLGARWNWEMESAELDVSAGVSNYSTELFSTDSVIDRLFQIEEISRGEFSNDLMDVRSSVAYTRYHKRHTLVAGFDMSQVSSVRSRLGAADRFEEMNQSSSTFGLFLQDEWKPVGKLVVKPGLRLTAYGSVIDGIKDPVTIFPEPRIMVSLSSGPWIFKGAAGRYYQFIHRIRTQSLFLNSPDFWSVSGDGYLPMLRSDQVMAGASYTIRGWTFDVEGYRKWSSGVTENLAAYYMFGELNGTGRDSILTGTGNSIGADVLLKKEFNGSQLWLSYSWNSTTNALSGLKYEIPSNFIQPHEFKGYYERKWRKWECSAAFVFGSGRYYTPLVGSQEVGGLITPLYGNLNSAQLPEYHRVDISASWLFMSGENEGKLTLSFYNVYNKRNIRDIQYINLSDAQEVKFVERRVEMLGILPALNFQYTF